MQQKRRRASAEWLLAVPVLTGAAGGAAPIAADLLLLVTAVLTAGVLWVRGARLTPGRRVPAGWQLLAVAVLAGVVPGAVLRFGRTPGPFDEASWLIALPAVLLAVVALVTLVPRPQLRAGGARLLSASALFASASVVIAEVVVGPVLAGRPLTAPARLVLELGSLFAAGLLTAVLVLIAVASGARRISGALLLLAVTCWVGAHAVALAGEPLQLWLVRDVLLVGRPASLVLLCLAALRDPGARAAAPAPRSTARPGLAGQLLPQLVLAAAVLAYLGAPLAGVEPSPVAAVALLCCLTLAAVHRAVVARDEARVGGRLRRSEAYFRSLVRSSSDPVLILDADLRVSWAAPALQPPAGAAALTGRPLTEVVHPEDTESVRSWLSGGAVAGGAPTGLRSFRLQDPSGDWRVFEAGVSDLRADADVRGLVLQCRDVTVRLDRELELSSLAFTDPLTGLPNRTAQRVALEGLIDGLADPAAEDVALLLIEVHGLAAAGEHTGRDVVEVALVEVARRLRATVRTEDQVARIGPELFSVLAHGTGDEPDRVASRCLSVIDLPITTEAGTVDLTGVVGLAPLAAGVTEAVARDRAELAVIDARAAGAGSVRRYRTELTAARNRREQLRHDLVGARERGELDLVWQPIVSLTDHRVTGVEALLRWQHPLHGDVPPDEFLPVAERAGLLVGLQRWVLHAATAAAATLPGHGQELKLGVNVSAQHLASGTLVGDVSSALRDSGLPPERLVVEIPESALVGADVTDDARALRLMGVHLALDDFGSGHSSLPGLGRLPVDIIKLDRALLSRVDRDPHTRAICAAVLTLGAALSVDVVAEGVETASQLGVLQSLGCGFAQGFLLSRPVTLTGLVQLLESHDGQLWPGIVGRVRT